MHPQARYRRAVNTCNSKRMCHNITCNTSSSCGQTQVSMMACSLPPCHWAAPDSRAASCHSCQRRRGGVVEEVARVAVEGAVPGYVAGRYACGEKDRKQSVSAYQCKASSGAAATCYVTALSTSMFHSSVLLALLPSLQPMQTCSTVLPTSISGRWWHTASAACASKAATAADSTC
jgi:hypothetical protein